MTETAINNGLQQQLSELENLDTESNERALTKVLQHKVPNARLEKQPLPQAPSITLALIESTYPQADLSAAQVEELMDQPPYWAFCWASGQVLAQYVLAAPDDVFGKTVLDFGTGSGVVAIACKLAGAKRVIALDNDPAALMACQLNAELNQVELVLSDSVATLDIDKSETVLLIADVFYDEQNIPMLAEFIEDYADVIVADSRVKPSALAGLTEVARYASSTVPDLGESSDFNSVGVYRLR